MDRVTNRVLLGLALACFALEWSPSVVGTGGYFIDELYYLACTDHLALGYVDHPPLSILLLRLVRALAGDSFPVLRAVPALAGAATVFLTGLLARRLGASGFGQVLAAGAVVAAPVYQTLFGFYSMNALSVLIWTTCFWVLVEIERRDEPRLWVAFGVLAGLGLENKHTIVLLGVGLAAGLALSPARRHLAGRWFWMGLGVAVLLALPNLTWQVAHGWVSLAFYRAQDLQKNISTPPLAVLTQQVLAVNPVALPIWLAGLIFFFGTERGRRYRHLGWIYAALLGLMLVGGKSRPDRIAAAYTALFAGGGALLGDVLARGRPRWTGPALLAALLLVGAGLAPITLPLLPPGLTTRYAVALGVVPKIERGPEKRSDLPQWLADRYEWERLVDDVAAAVASLGPDERRRAIVLARSYGPAASIEVLGRGRGLPPVYSGHNGYFMWGPPERPVDVAIVVGFGEPGPAGPLPEHPLPRLFADIELFRIHHCTWCMPWRDQTPIWLAREPKRPLREAWSQLRLFR